MLYILGARSVADEQVRIASTKIDGIVPKKAIMIRKRMKRMQWSLQRFLLILENESHYPKAYIEIERQAEVLKL
ncbi:hypothetical protein Ccrd_010970 [Cynara cardunculus var. scolymus]|uniref:Uncharacterized protein n=1 Tax=Cynara cardunculus var. scolymus TaxID=59895 RepID=A0A103YK38_CYNCS|nr:hypothetical protein Ccrd_010970 [Cynara cardunculus var. scolymus]